MSIDLTILTLMILLAAALFLGLRYHKQRTIRKLRSTPLSEQQRIILAKQFPLFTRIPSEERDRLEGLINQFLAEKSFHGKEGITISDNMKLLIAAQACLLVINKPNRWFDQLSTIIIYPAAFKSQIRTSQGHIHTDTEQLRSGESWMRGPVVLAWDQTKAGADNDRDGVNVVIHEFAHQLDNQTGITDGAPLLDRDQNDRQWAKVFQDAYARHQHNTARNKRTVMDGYGATNPAEFFAVAVETFFEQGPALKAEEDALYNALKTYFQLDPAIWR